MENRLSNLELKAYTKHIINGIEMGTYKNNLNKLCNDILYAFSNCESENEIIEYNTLLMQVSQKYNLNMEAWIQKSINVEAYNKLKQIISMNNQKVYGDNKSSYVAPDKSSIKSEYFIYYRPENKNLSNSCNSFIYKLISAEVRGTEEKFNRLMESFYECLSKCENENDLQQFNNFLIILSKKGKFAKEFYDLNSDKISLNNPNPYKQTDEHDEQIIANKKNMEVEYFNEKFKKALKESEEFETKGFYSQDDYDDMIRLYKQLREDLELIAPFIGKARYDMIYEEIEKYISYYKEQQEFAKTI